MPSTDYFSQVRLLRKRFNLQKKQSGLTVSGLDNFVYGMVAIYQNHDPESTHRSRAIFNFLDYCHEPSLGFEGTAGMVLLHIAEVQAVGKVIDEKEIIDGCQALIKAYLAYWSTQDSAIKAKKLEVFQTNKMRVERAFKQCSLI